METDAKFIPSPGWGETTRNTYKRTWDAWVSYLETFHLDGPDDIEDYDYGFDYPDTAYANFMSTMLSEHGQPSAEAAATALRGVYKNNGVAKEDLPLSFAALRKSGALKSAPAATVAAADQTRKEESPTNNLVRLPAPKRSANAVPISRVEIGGVYILSEAEGKMYQYTGAAFAAVDRLNRRTGEVVPIDYLKDSFPLYEAIQRNRGALHTLSDELKELGFKVNNPSDLTEILFNAILEKIHGTKNVLDETGMDPKEAAMDVAEFIAPEMYDEPPDEEAAG
jgi:hypothetical protein